MRLTELAPLCQPPNAEVPAYRLSFQCPRCRLGVVSVWLKDGASDPERGVHGCNGVPPNLDTLTITPSIADEGKCTAAKRNGCPGWHGHIINGEAA